jgi:glycosyltransferase involved in cell wall biosynthesis
MGASLRIGIDGILLRRQGKGVSRFVLSFLRAYAAAPLADLELVAFVDAAADLPILPEAPGLRYEPVRVSRSLAWDLRGFDRALRGARCDAALTLSDRVRTGVPYVLYLFEIPEYRHAVNRRHAGAYQRASDGITAAWFQRTLQGAAHIAASSAFTLRDLERKHGVPRRRMSVVHPAPDPAFRPPASGSAREAARAAEGAPGGYVLHVSSNNDPRDDTATALKAYATVRDRLPSGMPMLIAGVDTLRSFGWGELPRTLGIQDSVRCVGFRQDADLLRLYHGATLYLDTSLYEGFGFQVAEAQACGVPVVCSDTSSLPEVAGDAGLLVRPGDVEGFARAIVDVATNADVAASMAKQGKTQASRFGWDRTMAALVERLRSAADGRGTEAVA